MAMHAAIEQSSTALLQRGEKREQHKIAIRSELIGS